jgi:hypothetical protein
MPSAKTIYGNEMLDKEIDKVVELRTSLTEAT